MGDTLWTKQLTPSNIIVDNVYPRDLKKTSDGGYLMTGRPIVLKEWIEDGTRLDIADLTAGIYIATWLQNGQALKREKVVVLE